MVDALLSLMGDTFHQNGVEDNKDQEDASGSEDHLESLTKVPIQNVPESLVNLSKKIESPCFRCKEFGHMHKDCTEVNKPHKEDNTGPKKFEDYIYTYMQDLMSSPMMQMNLVNPYMVTNYDQALGVIKDSINRANPLASLNL